MPRKHHEGGEHDAPLLWTGWLGPGAGQEWRWGNQRGTATRDQAPQETVADGTSVITEEKDTEGRFKAYFGGRIHFLL